MTAIRSSDEQPTSSVKNCANYYAKYLERVRVRRMSPSVSRNYVGYPVRLIRNPISLN
jgi:hypothetical protein